MPPDAPAAYLVREDELNRDNTNYFIFSETGLRVMLHRAHWDVRDYISVGDTVHSDPVRPDRDERAFCLVRSRYMASPTWNYWTAGTKARKPAGAGPGGNSRFAYAAAGPRSP